VAQEQKRQQHLQKHPLRCRLLQLRHLHPLRCRLLHPLQRRPQLRLRSHLNPALSTDQPSQSGFLLEWAGFHFCSCEESRIMNIKVLATVLVLGIATTLGACGGGSEPAASPSGSASPAASPSK
jgi:hypothetical protein